mmetsp:Transcript_830/g.2276  ORF Transcript_830/g.2276 Transcript_830/m.2276 type:complete len:83 (+) Transcript_830:396-644(+)
MLFQLCDISDDGGQYLNVFPLSATLQVGPMPTIWVQKSGNLMTICWAVVKEANRANNEAYEQLTRHPSTHAMKNKSCMGNAI